MNTLWHRSEVSVGPLSAYVELFEGDRLVFKLDISRKEFTHDSRDSWAKYQEQWKQLEIDADRIIEAMNAANSLSNVTEVAASMGETLETKGANAYDELHRTGIWEDQKAAESAITPTPWTNDEADSSGHMLGGSK